MNTKKSKYWKSIVLGFLPVFLLYVQYSRLNYHSHIFANGESVTHSHPLADCANNSPNNQKNKTGNQIIVFHGVVLDLSDDVHEITIDKLLSQKPEHLLFKSSQAYSFIFSPDTSDRAPPCFYS